MLHLGFCFRDAANQPARSDSERERLLHQAERHVQAAHDALRTLGLPAAFHRASALQSIANVANDLGQRTRARRLFKRALRTIDERVQKLGWDDHSYGNPRGLRAAIISNSVVELLKDEEEAAYREARSLLKEALDINQDARLLIRLAQIDSLQGAVQQDRLDALCTAALDHSISFQEFQTLAQLLSEGAPTEVVNRFFFQTIEGLCQVRRGQFSHAEADHTAATAQYFARHWAKLLAKHATPIEAFCAVEANAALRLQEAVRFHGWSPVDEAQERLYRDWSTAGSLSAELDHLAAQVDAMPEALREPFIQDVIRRFDPVGPADDDSIDHLDPAVLDRFWAEFQRLDSELPTAAALREHARVLDAEADELREQLEADPAFVASRDALPPLQPDQLSKVLALLGDRGVLRIEHLTGELLVLYLDVNNGDVRQHAAFVPFPDEPIVNLDWEAFWRTGCLPPDASAALANVRLGDALPDFVKPRIVLLASGLLQWLPLLAVGPENHTLLDRFSAIHWGWSLANIRVQPFARSPRRGLLTVYPGRDLGYDDPKGTAYHAIAQSGAPLESDVRGSDAYLDEVLEAWGAAATVSFYGHGDHVAMSGEGRDVGPQLLLGSGETVSMSNLGWSTFGVDLVEMWACRSGLDLPWDPSFPLSNEGFGFDHELIKAGARATIGTLWSVDELVTSLICLKYRVGRRAQIDPATALADAQRWWRDTALPRLAAEPDLPDCIVELWREVLGSEPDQWDVRAVQGHLRGRDQDRLRAEVTSPIAHAAYRFCGGVTPPG